MSKLFMHNKHASTTANTAARIFDTTNDGQGLARILAFSQTKKANYQPNSKLLDDFIGNNIHLRSTRVLTDLESEYLILNRHIMNSDGACCIELSNVARNWNAFCSNPNYDINDLTYSIVARQRAFDDPTFKNRIKMGVILRTILEAVNPSSRNSKIGNYMAGINYNFPDTYNNFQMEIL